jgi:hypothetical protein
LGISLAPFKPQNESCITKGGAVYTKAGELIDSLSGYRDIQLVGVLFNNVDVGRILQIPLNNHGFKDFISSGLMKHGHYTMQPNYYVQWKHQFDHKVNHLALP